MSQIGLMLCLDVPDPVVTQAAKPLPPPVSLEERVHDALELIDSGHESSTTWIMIKRLYAELQKRPNSARAQRLMTMMRPVLAKYGYHDVGASPKTGE